MDAYLTGGVNRPAVAPATQPPPSPPPPITTPTNHHLFHIHNHQQQSASINHQDSHSHQNSHQLAPQQRCLGQGWAGIRRRRPRGNKPRSLSRPSGRNTSSAWWSQSYLSHSSRTTAPVLQRERKAPGQDARCITYKSTTPPSTRRPSRPAVYRHSQGKSVPPRPVVGVFFYRPDPS